MDQILHVLGVVVLVLTGISAAMSIVYYALAFSDRCSSIIRHRKTFLVVFLKNG
ncbi:MAG TPA: hypothetical protein VKU00_07340 [Chthonomonadaceae bacterium]|nr:hypothetical protein [Chthonomonadaceae bacterium]